MAVCRWSRRFTTYKVEEMQRLKQVEEENGSLSRCTPSLDYKILKDVIEKKF